MKFFKSLLITLLALASVFVDESMGAVDDPCAPNCVSQTDGTFFAHPQNCTLHYLCRGGESDLLACQNGFHFNPTINACDYPSTAGCTADENYDCGEPVSSTSTVIMTSTTEQTTTTVIDSTAPATTEQTTTTVIDTTTTTEQIATTDGECIPPCPSPSALYPDPHDCTMYFHCGDNVPYHKSCPPGQEYWAEMERCDYPEYAQCTADPDAPCVAITNSPTSPQPTDPTDPSGDCIPECPSPEAVYPHPQDCTKFIHCANSNPNVFTCPDGQEYNAELDRCDWPADANCNFDENSPCIAITQPPLHY